MMYSNDNSNTLILLFFIIYKWNLQEKIFQANARLFSLSGGHGHGGTSPSALSFTTLDRTSMNLLSLPSLFVAKPKCDYDWAEVLMVLFGWVVDAREDRKAQVVIHFFKEKSRILNFIHALYYCRSCRKPS